MSPYSASRITPLGDFFVFGAFGDDVIAVRSPYPPLRTDVNFDGCVDDSDLLTVLFAFGSSERTADANRDGVADDADLLIVLFQFGGGCAE